MPDGMNSFFKHRSLFAACLPVLALSYTSHRNQSPLSSETGKEKSIQFIRWGLGFLAVTIIIFFVSLKMIDTKQSDGSSRDLSTPSSRLVGSWQMYSRSGLPSHVLFFGPIGEDGRGKGYTEDVDGVTIACHYAIVNEAKKGSIVTIQKYLGDDPFREVRILIDQTGLRGSYKYVWFGEQFDQRISYIDDRISSVLAETAESLTPPQNAEPGLVSE